MKKYISILWFAILCITCNSDEDLDQLEDTNLEIFQENYKLSTGEVITVFTDQITDLGNRKEITFMSTDLSFTMTTSQEGETIHVDAVNFRGSESSIVTSRNTELAPLTTVTGTFTCDMCPPPLDNTSIESFNFLFTNASGNDTNITTQTTLNGIASNLVWYSYF